MARLVVLSEGYTGTAHELKAPMTTVGRVEGNNFQIPDASVSSRHCEILLQGEQVLVKDLNSTNGTFIDGEQISEGTLKPGQILRLGQIDMRLESGTSPGTGGRKVAERTMVIPQGVKLDELEQTGTKFVKFDKDSPFQKKSNKSNKVILIVGGVLVLVIVAFFVIAALNLKK